MVEYRHTDYYAKDAPPPTKGLRYFAYDGNFWKIAAGSTKKQILDEAALVNPLYMDSGSLKVRLSGPAAVGNQSIVLTSNAIDAVQDIRTTASPSFTNLSLSGYLQVSGTSGYVRFQAAATGASYTITLPSAAPGNNTFLKYNGTSYVWATIVENVNVSVQSTLTDVFTIDASQTLIATAGLTKGLIMWHNGTKWTTLAKPASNKFLRNTSAGDVTWEDIPSPHDAVTLDPSLTDIFQLSTQQLQAKTGLVAGDLVYYTGTKFTRLPRPTTGTQLLQNTTSGVLSWVDAPTSTSYWTRTGSVLTTATANDEVHLSTSEQKLSFGTTKQFQIYHSSAGALNNGYLRMAASIGSLFVHMYNTFYVFTPSSFTGSGTLGESISRWSTGYFTVADATKFYSTTTGNNPSGLHIYREKSSQYDSGLIRFNRLRASGTALVDGDWMGVIAWSNFNDFQVGGNQLSINGIYALGGSYLEFYQGSTYVLGWNSARNINFNNAYSFPNSIGAAGKVLKVPLSGTLLEWGDASSPGLWEENQTYFLKPISSTHRAIMLYDNSTNTLAHTDITYPGHITMLKKYGTDPVNDDLLGRISWGGWNGTAYGTAFTISVEANGAWDLSNHNSTMVIQRFVHNGTSSKIAIDQNIELQGTSIYFSGITGWQYIFPNSNGTANQMMINNGSGTLSWASLTSGASASDVFSLSGITLSAASGLSTGNIIYYDTNKWTKLATGTDGQFLKLVSGKPAWSNVSDLWTYSGGFLTPTTASHPIRLDCNSGSYLSMYNGTVTSTYQIVGPIAIYKDYWGVDSFVERQVQAGAEFRYNYASNGNSLNVFYYYAEKRSAGNFVAHSSGDKLAGYVYFGRHTTNSGPGLTVTISASENWTTSYRGVNYVIQSNLNETNTLIDRLYIAGAGYVKISGSSTTFLNIEEGNSYWQGNAKNFYFPNSTISKGAILYGLSTSSATWLTAGTAGQVLAVKSDGTLEWITSSGGTTYSAGDGIDISGGNVISVDYNVTNLKITSTELNTIQDISSTSDVTFNSATLAAIVKFNDGQTVPNYITIGAPNTVNTSYSIVLPDDPPASGTYLKFDGTDYVWAAASGSSSLLFSYPLWDNSGTVSLLYNSTNLKKNGSNQLDTIQDIATTSNVTFANVTATTAVKLKGAGAYYISLKAGSGLAADYDIVFPQASPSADTYLLYNGTGWVWEPTNTFSAPLLNTAGVVSLTYNTTNLKISGGTTLNTIQDIATTSDVTFNKVTNKEHVLAGFTNGSVLLKAQNTGNNWTLTFPNVAPTVANSFLVAAAGGALSWATLQIDSSISSIFTLSGQTFTAANNSHGDILYYNGSNGEWETLGAPGTSASYYLRNTLGGSLSWTLVPEITIGSGLVDVFASSGHTINTKSGITIGTIMYHDGSKWTTLGKPDADKVLQNSSSGTLTWVAQTSGVNYSAGDGIIINSNTISAALHSNGNLVFVDDSGKNKIDTAQGIKTTSSPTFVNLTLNGHTQYNGAISGYARIQASATTTSYTITLPDAAPGTDTYLKFNGTNYVWATVFSGSGSKWTDNTTHIIPNDSRDVYTSAGKRFVADNGYFYDGGSGNPVYFGTSTASKNVTLISTAGSVYLTNSAVSVGLVGSSLYAADQTVDLGTAAYKWKSFHSMSATLYGSSANVVLSVASGGSASYPLYFPSANGVSGDVMMLNAGGELVWSQVATGISIDTTIAGLLANTGQNIKLSASAQVGDIFYVRDNGGTSQITRLAAPATADLYDLTNSSSGTPSYSKRLFTQSVGNPIIPISGGGIQVLAGDAFISGDLWLYHSTGANYVTVQNRSENVNSSVYLTIWPSGSPINYKFTPSAFSGPTGTTVGTTSELFAGMYSKQFVLAPSSGAARLTHAYAGSGTSYQLTWPASGPGGIMMLQSDSSGNLSWVTPPSLWQYSSIYTETGSEYYVNLINDGYNQVVVEAYSDTLYPIYAFTRQRSELADIIDDDVLGSTKYYGLFNGNTYKFTEVISWFEAAGDTKRSVYKIQTSLLDGSNTSTYINALELSDDRFIIASNTINIGGQVINWGSNNDLYLPVNAQAANTLYFASSPVASSWYTISQVFNATYGSVTLGSLLYRGDSGWAVYNPGSEPTNGYVLSWNTTTHAPSWVAASGGSSLWTQQSGYIEPSASNDVYVSAGKKLVVDDLSIYQDSDEDYISSASADGMTIKYGNTAIGFKSSYVDIGLKVVQDEGLERHSITSSYQHDMSSTLWNDYAKIYHLENYYSYKYDSLGNQTNIKNAETLYRRNIYTSYYSGGQHLSMIAYQNDVIMVDEASSSNSASNVEYSSVLSGTTTLIKRFAINANSTVQIMPNASRTYTFGATALYPDTDSTIDLGTSSLYWKNIFADKYFITSTQAIYSSGNGLIIENSEAGEGIVINADVITLSRDSYTNIIYNGIDLYPSASDAIRIGTSSYWFAQVVAVDLTGRALNLFNATKTYKISFSVGTIAQDYGYTLPTSLPSVSNQALICSTSGVLSWASVLTNPMTTEGDIIIGGTNGAPTRLAKSTTNDWYLKSTSSGIVWAAVSGGSSPLSAKGDIYTRTSSQDERLGVGTNNYVLIADSTETVGLKWIEAPWDKKVSNVIYYNTDANYTLALTDAGAYRQHDVSNARDVIVPKNSDVAFAVGTVITIEQTNLGQITIKPVDGDVTLNKYGGLKTAGRYTIIQLTKTNTNTWTVLGGIA